MQKAVLKMKALAKVKWYFVKKKRKKTASIIVLLKIRFQSVMTSEAVFLSCMKQFNI